MLQQVQAEEAALHAARGAVARKARGLTAAAIRELLIEELRAQGSELPDEDVLERQVGRIQRTVPPGASIPEGILALTRSFRHKRATDKELRSALRQPQMLSGPHGEEPYLVLADRSLPMAQAEVDQEAITRLEPEAPVFVSLLQEAGDDLSGVAVYIAEHRVGILSADDAARYQPAMTAAHEKGTVLMVQGVISSGSSGDKQLRIYAAGIL